MKKTSLILIATCLISVSLYGQIKYSDDVWTLEEVKSMVSKYNLQDSVTATKNNGLMYKKREDIEDWCQHWVKAINESAIRTAFFKNTEKVRTRADFYNLIDSFLDKKYIIKSNNNLYKLILNFPSLFLLM